MFGFSEEHIFPMVAAKGRGGSCILRVSTGNLPATNHRIHLREDTTAARDSFPTAADNHIDAGIGRRRGAYGDGDTVSVCSKACHCV